MSSHPQKPSDNKPPHRWTFLSPVLEELRMVLVFLPYLGSVFSTLLFPHPAIHSLLFIVGTVLGCVFTRELGVQLWRQWTSGPTEPPATFCWWRVLEDLLMFLEPVALLALLMSLNQSPW